MSIDWAAFWHLGGHGWHVWPGYAAAALWVGIEVVVLLRALRSDTPARDGEAA